MILSNGFLQQICTAIANNTAGLATVGFPPKVQPILNEISPDPTTALAGLTLTNDWITFIEGVEGNQSAYVDPVDLEHYVRLLDPEGGWILPSTTPDEDFFVYGYVVTMAADDKVVGFQMFADPVKFHAGLANQKLDLGEVRMKIPYSTGA